MSELAITVTSRSLFYTVGDLFIVPDSTGRCRIEDTAFIRKGGWGHEINHPIRVYHVGLITGDRRIAFSHSWCYEIPYARTLYYHVRDLLYSTYQIDNFRPYIPEYSELRMTWKCVCDSIRGMLY